MAVYKVPSGLLYTETHEWVKLEGDIAFVGITDFAQSKLGDVVYVDLPEPGRIVKKGEKVCEIESVKTVADIYAPLSGEIVEVNDKLTESPEIVNLDPYGEGWIFKLRIFDKKETDSLLTPERYRSIQED